MAVAGRLLEKPPGGLSKPLRGRMKCPAKSVYIIRVRPWPCRVYTWSNDIRVVQRILGHRSLASTRAYLKSLTALEVWTAFWMVAA